MKRPAPLLKLSPYFPAASPQRPTEIKTACSNFIMLLMLVLSACSSQDSPAPPAPRPVKVFRVGEQVTQSALILSGAVQARYETTLAFRVAGKVLLRQVEIGGQVRKGQLLARLDAADYRLASQALSAQLVAARAEAVFTKADLARSQELFDQHLISPPELDRHRTANIAAKERVVALEAQLDQTNNQLAYTDLVADRDGVVTWLQVESGQVVAAGQPLLKLAQLDEKEILIHIPEHRISEVKIGQSASVTLWAKPDHHYAGRIREIAGAADPASRSYDAKVALLEGKNDARLGMTATLEIPLASDPQITIPLSALYAPGGGSGQAKVWLVDETKQTVSTVPVVLSEPVSDGRIVVSGLQAGQLIVSAGVHRLNEGQAVRRLEQDSVKTQP